MDVTIYTLLIKMVSPKLAFCPLPSLSLLCAATLAFHQAGAAVTRCLEQLWFKLELLHQDCQDTVHFVVHLKHLHERDI